MRWFLLYALILMWSYLFIVSATQDAEEERAFNDLDQEKYLRDYYLKKKGKIDEVGCAEK